VALALADLDLIFHRHEDLEDLVSMTRAERAALGFLHKGRIDVIGAGALVWRTIIQRLQRDAGVVEVITSEHDILDGIALSIA
jgi:exopolyphosphatase/guanosine-5'-triphosphate,3'-diphosphate pyrophosphatase